MGQYLSIMYDELLDILDLEGFTWPLLAGVDVAHICFHPTSGVGGLSAKISVRYRWMDLVLPQINPVYSGNDTICLISLGPKLLMSIDNLFIIQRLNIRDRPLGHYQLIIRFIPPFSSQAPIFVLQVSKSAHVPKATVKQEN